VNRLKRSFFKADTFYRRKRVCNLLYITLLYLTIKAFGDYLQNNPPKELRIQCVIAPVMLCLNFGQDQAFRLFAILFHFTV